MNKWLNNTKASEYLTKMKNFFNDNILKKEYAIKTKCI